MTVYPRESLYQEIAFICYYFHWELDAAMNLDHRQRRLWCGEISRINRLISPDKDTRPNVW